MNSRIKNPLFALVTHVRDSKLLTVLLALGLMGFFKANAQQVSDACWSGTWTGPYTEGPNSSGTGCTWYNTGDTTITLSVVDGAVVSASGSSSGVTCIDFSTCDVTGYGTLSGDLSGTISDNTITLSGSWIDDCNFSNYPVYFQETLSGCAMTGTQTFSREGSCDSCSQVTVTLSASPTEGGIVNGGGSFPSGQSITVTATPNSDYTFTNWTDGNGNVVSTSASYTFTVTQDVTLVANFASVDAPTADSQSVTLREGTPTSITLTGSDPNDPPLPLTYTVTVNPTQGTLSGTPPNLTYTPNDGYAGPDSFQFTVNNGYLSSAAAKVSITVGVAAPTANDQSQTVPVNTTTPITLSGSDPNTPPLPLTYSVTANPTQGTLSGTPPNVSYTPNDGYTGQDSFQFTVNNGYLSSAPATVSITVGVKAPTANGQSVTVDENTLTSITLSGSDPNTPPLPLTYTVTVNPTQGTLSGTPPGLTYSPNNGYTGQDSFQFTVNNGYLTSDPATVSITVATSLCPDVTGGAYYFQNPANDPPNTVPARFGPGGKFSTISYGCALCSSANMLNSFGYNVTPLKLDSALVEAGGYESDGKLNFDFVEVAAVFCGIENIYYAGAQDSLLGSDYDSVLSQHFCSMGQSVILQLTEWTNGVQYRYKNGQPAHHYILVTGQNGNDWNVFDPGWVSAPRTLGGHLNGFSTVGIGPTARPVFRQFQVAGYRFFASANAPNDLTVTTEGSIEPFVTDPNGLVAGFDPVSHTNVETIPGSTYTADGVIADAIGTGIPLGGPDEIQTIFIPNPVSGTYQISHVGTGTGSYAVNARLKDASAISPSASYKGTAHTTLASTNYFSIVIPSDCSYALSTTNEFFDAPGGAGNVGITVPNGCAWAAHSTNSFIRITSGATGSGNGIIGYSVSANTATAPRSGALTIAGQIVTITQDAAACKFTLLSTVANFSATGGSGKVTVAANGGNCPWTAVSTNSFITIITGNTGSGSGAVTYSVAPNHGTTTRTGTINIAGKTFTVHQARSAIPLDLKPAGAE